MTEGIRRKQSAAPEQEAWRSRSSDPDLDPDSDPDPGAILPLSFFARPARVVARGLLGCVLRSTVSSEVTAGRIVETEAYVGPDDPACHGARRIGLTERNRSMFGPPGTAYVYFIYGMHWCFNAVASREGDPQAVLVRALEPLEGIDAMSRRREGRPELASGPARLCQALGIDGALDGHDLSRLPLVLEAAPSPPAPEAVAVSGRIGIREARDWPLRFFLKDDPHVSSGPHLTLAPERPHSPG